MMIPPREYAPLPHTTERAISVVIDSAMLVHRELGAGFLEAAYRNALCLELKIRGVSYEMEKPIVVKYRGEAIAVQRIDLIVESAVIVELKAVETLTAIHQAQLMSYMRASAIRAGLLMNFGGTTLKQGLKRIVI
jgi:GxxExxY protein